MKNRFLLLLLIIFPYFLSASQSNANPEDNSLIDNCEHAQINLPEKFKKSDWCNLHDYSSGQLPIMYNQEEDSELNNIVGLLQENNLCFVESRYNRETQEYLAYYYENIARCVQKSLAIKNEALYEKDAQKKAKKCWRDDIKRDENDIVLLDKEINMLESIQNPDPVAIKEVIDTRKAERVLKQERLSTSKNELRNNEINSNQYIKRSTYKLLHFEHDRDMFDLKIRKIKLQNKDKKITLNCKNSPLKFEQFQDYVKEIDTKNQAELNKIILLQSLVVASLDTRNMSLKQLKNLPIYHYYIFSLGIFFKWYTNTTWCDFETYQNDIKNINSIDSLLHNSIKKWSENKNENEKKYKESFLSLVRNGLHRYEYAWTSQWKIDDYIMQYQFMSSACKRVLLLLDTFKHVEYFQTLYEDKKKLLEMYVDSWFK